MVKIRLKRGGKKKQPHYKIVIADSRTARTGKYIAAIGTYNPLSHPIQININESRLFMWLKRGAQPTDTVRSLLSRLGLLLKWSLIKKGVNEESIAEQMEQWRLKHEEKLRREEEKKQRRKSARKKKVSAEEQSPTVPA